jgi:hypothetical protein
MFETLRNLPSESNVAVPGQASLQSASPFAPLIPLIVSIEEPKQDADWHLPSEGLKAISEVVRRLRAEKGRLLFLDDQLRTGCLWDLEQFASLLREAEHYGAAFCLVLVS